MKKAVLFFLMLLLTLGGSSCVTRIAPFSPHRTNTDAHRQSENNQACLDCHAIVEVGKDHRPSDDCLRCHRILQGD